MSNAIIKATAATAAAATLLGVGVTPAFADQTAAPDGDQGQNQTQPTGHERLAAAIKAADAKAAQDRDWDKESKDAFDKAYAAAKAVGNDASDQDAATAASALETATDGLKSAAEKALDDAKAQAGTLKESDYTEASWQALKSALDDADALKATDDKTGDARRRSKADAITAAVNGLDLQARADLSDSIAAAKAKRDGGRVWTADSRGTLDDILEQADKLIGESHDKTALASMKDSVDKAAGNLESQPTADLKHAIARYNALDLGRFTESERESVKEARGSARTADGLADNADNDTVRADAARDLNAAIDALSYPAVERLDKAVRAADAKAARDRDWDKDSKAAFDKAHEAAKGPFDDTKAGDVERVKAAESLEDATKSLTTVQRVELKAEARKADAIDRTRLTDESAKALKDAIDAAGTDPSDDKAGDDRAAELTGVLRTAEKNAESKTHAAVREAIARYDDMVTADGHRDWTDTTAATNAYTAAKGTLSDEDTVDYDIARQKAADQLVKSLDALTTRQQDAYAAAVKAANARLADGKYTQDSRNALKEELDRDGGLGKATDKAGDMERAAAAGRINAAIDATVRVSRAKLDAAIGTATAKGSQERDWDRTTRKAFDEALAAAQAAGGDADDATLDGLSDALSKATAALTTTQRTTFSATVDRAEAMAKDARYTAGFHTRLTAAVGSARNDVASATDDKAGDDRYADATATLRTVMDAPEYETDQSLKDAIASADALNARGLTYGSGMAGEKSAFDDAYAKAKRDRNKDGDTQKADASALDRAQKALVGKSDQEKAYSGAASNARALKAQDYTEDSYGRLDALLTGGFDSGSATGKELDARAKAISDAIDALEVSSWTVDGATLTQEDGEWTGHVTLDGAPKDVKAVGADGRTVDLKATGGSFVQGSGKLGVGVVSGTLTGSAPPGVVQGRLRIRRRDGDHRLRRRTGRGRRVLQGRRRGLERHVRRHPGHQGRSGRLRHGPHHPVRRLDVGQDLPLRIGDRADPRRRQAGQDPAAPHGRVRGQGPPRLQGARHRRADLHVRRVDRTVPVLHGRGRHHGARLRARNADHGRQAAGLHRPARPVKVPAGHEMVRVRGEGRQRVRRVDHIHGQARRHGDHPRLHPLHQARRRRLQVGRQARARHRAVPVGAEGRGRRQGGPEGLHRQRKGPGELFQGRGRLHDPRGSR